MCLAITALYAFLAGLTNAVSRTSTGIVDPTTVSPDQVLAAGFAALAAIAALTLVNIIVFPITLGALSLVGSAAVYGDEVDTGHVMRRAIDRSLDVVAVFVVSLLLLGVGPFAVGMVALIVVAVAPEVGFALVIFGVFLLLIPVLYVAVRLSLAIPVAMRERRGPVQSLRRSWELVAHRWWWVFGIAVVMGLVIAVVNASISYRSFFGRDTMSDFVVGFVFSAIAAAITAILYGVASGVVYGVVAPEAELVAPPGAESAPIAAVPDAAPVETIETSAPAPAPPVVPPTDLLSQPAEPVPEQRPPDAPPTPPQ